MIFDLDHFLSDLPELCYSTLRRWPKLLVTMAYADTIVEAYDFEAERWVSLTEKPSVTFGAEACYMKGKLLTIGGVQSKQVDQYDLETNTWAPHFPRQLT